MKILIRNSPRLGRTPLRDTTQTVTKVKAITTPGTNAAAVKRVAVPVKGKGRKRSASENWLEHVPSSTVENGKKTSEPSFPHSLPPPSLSLSAGGVLQPQLKKKRTVSTPKPKDFQSKRVGRYCLQHQEEDSEGDIKTALYKVTSHTHTHTLTYSLSLSLTPPLILG